MSLSCDCGGWDFGWFYDAPETWSRLLLTRRKRCYSCNVLIDIGATVGKFGAWRPSETDIEERIYGDEVPRADFYMCETCIGLFWAMTDQGYCIVFDDEKNMLDLAKLTGDLNSDDR